VNYVSADVVDWDKWSVPDVTDAHVNWHPVTLVKVGLLSNVAVISIDGKGYVVPLDWVEVQF
jgi:hypothetical protein